MKKNAQTTKDPFENFIRSSKRSPNQLEGDRDRGCYNSFFQGFQNKNNIKLLSRNTSAGAVFAESYNRTIRDLLKRPVFEKGDGKWIDVLPTKANNIILEYIHRLS